MRFISDLLVVVSLISSLLVCGCSTEPASPPVVQPESDRSTQAGLSQTPVIDAPPDVNSEVESATSAVTSPSKSSKSVADSHEDVTPGEWFDLLSDDWQSHWQMVADVNSTTDWILDDGILRCNTRFNGWIVSREQYSDFEFEVEYRLVAQGNSGIHYRYSGVGSIEAPGFLEVQILEDATFPGELRPMERTGAIWKLAGPIDPEPKPAGEWNSMALLCRGNLHQVTLNGKRIVDVRLSDPQIRSTGYIAISNTRGRAKDCEFRNIRVRRWK